MSRRVLVTAGASGIGRAIAERFLADGDEVAICDADPAAVSAFSQANGKAIAAVADVTSEADVQAIVAKSMEPTGKLNGCVANAGGGGMSPVSPLIIASSSPSVGLGLRHFLHSAFLANWSSSHGWHIQSPRFMLRPLYSPCN